MYNLYYKGLSTDSIELNEIKKYFGENKVNLNVVFENYSNLPITEQFRKANPMGKGANLICHAMGCNLGILTAIKTPK